MTNVQLKNLEKFVKESNSIIFFGGAGVSTESGIPDFRSKNGLYNQRDIRFEQYEPEYLLSSKCLHREPNVFFEFYRQKMDTRNFDPNITHKVLAKMEAIGKLKAIVTQNIDGLHQKAGSKNVFEIHGTTHRNYCEQCGKEYDSEYIFASSGVPRCACGGLVRPDVVLYGEELPDAAVSGAVRAIASADCLIIGGTSLQVYPAANYISYFKGDHLIVINKEPLKDVYLDPCMDLKIVDSLGKVFVEIDKFL